MNRDDVQECYFCGMVMFNPQTSMTTSTGITVWICLRCEDPLQTKARLEQERLYGDES